LDAEEENRGSASKDRSGEDHLRQRKSMHDDTEAWSEHKVRKKLSVARITESPFLDLAPFRRGSTSKL